VVHGWPARRRLARSSGFERQQQSNYWSWERASCARRDLIDESAFFFSLPSAVLELSHHFWWNHSTWSKYVLYQFTNELRRPTRTATDDASGALQSQSRPTDQTCWRLPVPATATLLRDQVMKALTKWLTESHCCDTYLLLDRRQRPIYTETQHATADQMRQVTSMTNTNSIKAFDISTTPSELSLLAD